MNYRDITDDLMSLQKAKEIAFQIVIKDNLDIMMNRIILKEKAD